jgi:hypothetical protein
VRLPAPRPGGGTMSDLAIPPDATAAGHCHRCGTWSSTARIVAEIHSDSGAGATVVRCAGPCTRPIRRTRATRTRTYQL